MVAIAMSLSDRLSFAGLGTTGSSISNLVILDNVPFWEQGKNILLNDIVLPLLLDPLTESKQHNIKTIHSRKKNIYKLDQQVAAPEKISGGAIFLIIIKVTHSRQDKS